MHFETDERLVRRIVDCRNPIARPFRPVIREGDTSATRADSDDQPVLRCTMVSDPNSARSLPTGGNRDDVPVVVERRRRCPIDSPHRIDPHPLEMEADRVILEGTQEYTRGDADGRSSIGDVHSDGIQLSIDPPSLADETPRNKDRAQQTTDRSHTRPSAPSRPGASSRDSRSPPRQPSPPPRSPRPRSARDASPLPLLLSSIP